MSRGQELMEVTKGDLLR